MAHSFARITVHVVFSTKGRRNLIPQNKLQELFAYMIGIARNKKIPLLAVGGMPKPRSPLAWIALEHDLP